MNKYLPSDTDKVPFILFRKHVVKNLAKLSPKERCVTILITTARETTFFRYFSLISPLSSFASTTISFSSPSSRRLSDTLEKYSTGNNNSLGQYTRIPRCIVHDSQHQFNFVCFLSWKRNFNTLLPFINRHRRGIVY